MVDVGKILTELGITYRSLGKDYQCKCWFHDEKNPSMHVHKEYGYFHCFSCHRRGSIFTLVSQQTKTSGIDTVLFLNKFAKGALTEEAIRDTLFKDVGRRGRLKLPKRTIVQLPKHRKIDSHPYLEKRGVPKGDIEKWEMGVVTGTLHNGWILIPLYQEKKLISYFLRNPYGDEKIYGKYPRTSLLAGIDFCPDISKKIYVLEGIFDSINFSKTRHQCVAALSNRLLNDQLKVLSKYKEVILVPDNDAPGQQLVMDALPLIHSTSIKVCSLPENRKDAGECSLDDMLNAIYYNEKPILEYLI